jgi:hypothetical protein
MAWDLSKAEGKRVKQGSSAFFKKSAQKTFVRWFGRVLNIRTNPQQFFGSFFQKRTASSGA